MFAVLILAPLLAVKLLGAAGLAAGVIGLIRSAR